MPVSTDGNFEAHMKRYWPMARFSVPGWFIVVLIITAVLLLPLIALIWVALSPSTDVWGHLWSTVLPRSIATTLTLMLGVGILSAVIGVSTAWLVVMCRFPGRGLFNILLLLPLAFPTYIVAYCYTEFFEYTGPVQTAIRALFGYQSGRDYWFFEIRSLPGAVIVMSLVLYPYVYLTTRAMFLMQSACTLDVSRTLGANPWRLFWRVALPLARPAIVVGVTLALMECLNDIGAVEFFGVKTLTFTIYDTWLNRGSLSGAAQIACVMLIFVVVLISMERMARRQSQYHVMMNYYRALPSYRLSNLKAVIAIIACLGPVIFGFILPVGVLFSAAFRRFELINIPQYVRLATHSFLLAALAACVTAVIGLMIAYAVRLRPTPSMRIAARLSAIGYAIPGTVLAIGILFPVAALDNTINSLFRALFDINTGLLFIGSGTALVFAYIVRFLAVSIGAMESGLAKITRHLDMAARTLGRSERQTLMEVHLPMVRPILLAATLLVFVDCMKELPATLLLRPFNFETLATFVYAQASRGAFEDGALAALTIVFVGLFPVIFLIYGTTAAFRNISGKRHSIEGGMVNAPIQY